MAVTNPLARRPATVRPLRTSARSQLRGVITSIVHGAINAEVGLLVNDRIVVDALITNGSAEELGLHPGKTAVALIKSTFVTLVQDVPGLRISADNQIGGVITALSPSPVETEVVIDIGGGAEIVALVTSHSAQDMMLAPGMPITACIKAAHIILAVED